MNAYALFRVKSVKQANAIEYNSPQKPAAIRPLTFAHNRNRCTERPTQRTPDGLSVDERSTRCCSETFSNSIHIGRKPLPNGQSCVPANNIVNCRSRSHIEDHHTHSEYQLSGERFRTHGAGVLFRIDTMRAHVRLHCCTAAEHSAAAFTNDWSLVRRFRVMLQLRHVGETRFALHASD